MRAESNEVVEALRAKFPTARDFAAAYSPTLQRSCALNAAQCYRGTAPSLRNVVKAYGETPTATWIEAQLFDLAEYAGTKDKLGERQRQDTGLAILTGFPNLNAAELLLFFARFKTGRYGHFYGAVDPLAITGALRAFSRERASEIAQIEEREATAERLKAHEGTCSREEYLKLKARAEQGDPAAIQALTPPTH